MKIAVIGSGRIGGALGKAWANHGHTLQFGSRQPDAPEMQATLHDIPGATATDIQTAVHFGDVVVFAIPGSAMQATIQALDGLTGKILIDCTNGLGSATQSGAEMIAGWAPGAKVFKAFNSIGFENLSQPQFGSIQADMLFCGDGAAECELVASLIADVGLRPVYVGNLSQAGLAEMVARLWGALAYGQKRGRRLAFKIMEEQTGVSS